MAKSLGTLLLPVARELDLPGVWLTPLLHEAAVRTALSAHGVPSLLVGGTGVVTAWDPLVARGTRAAGWEVLEVDGADHSLEMPGDTHGSLAVLGRVLRAVEDVVARWE